MHDKQLKARAERQQLINLQQQFGFSSIPAIDEILEVESDVSHSEAKRQTDYEDQSINDISEDIENALLNDQAQGVLEESATLQCDLRKD